MIQVGDIEIGGDQVQVMAGPCAVESREQLLESAYRVKEAGATILRGRGFQTPDLTLLFSGPGRGRPEVAGGSPRTDRTFGGDRGYGPAVS